MDFLLSAGLSRSSPHTPLRGNPPLHWAQNAFVPGSRRVCGRSSPRTLMRVWRVLLVLALVLAQGLNGTSGWIMCKAARLPRVMSAAETPWWSTYMEPVPQTVQTKVAVLGGGAFSLAMIKVLGYRNTPTRLLVRNASVAQAINSQGRHPNYLSDFVLPPNLWATADPTSALKDADAIIHAVPMQQSRAFLQSVRHLIPTSTPLLSVSKGVEHGTFCLMSDVISQTLGPSQSAAFLSGPSFAKEIVQELATAVVIASSSPSVAHELCDLLTTQHFRCHTSADVKGVELGGALKNVIALAAGMCEGLGLGMNAMSALVTRGCLEMTNLGKLFGAQPETFYGLAGVGDTFGTCLGPLSRNRQVGYRLAQGEPLEAILCSLGGVSEGVSTALALEDMVRGRVRGVKFKFPIIAAVAEVLRGKATPRFGLELLMRYPLRDEHSAV